MRYSVPLCPTSVVSSGKDIPGHPQVCRGATQRWSGGGQTASQLCWLCRHMVPKATRCVLGVGGGLEGGPLIPWALHCSRKKLPENQSSGLTRAPGMPEGSPLFLSLPNPPVSKESLMINLKRMECRDENCRAQSSCSVNLHGSEVLPASPGSWAGPPGSAACSGVLALGLRLGNWKVTCVASWAEGGNREAHPIGPPGPSLSSLRIPA